MDSEIFVNVINKVVLEASVESMKSKLNQPPGRRPSENLVLMSNWFNRLSNDDKEMAIGIVRETARVSVFGFLCVLDGMRAIETENKGDLKLYYEKGGQKILLNDQERSSLHELL